MALATATGWVVASRLAAFGGRPEGARLARMERSPQWRDGRFVNPQPIRNHLWRMARDLLDASDHRTPAGGVPVVPVDPARLATPPASGLRVTWLGHSTLLLEMDGHRRAGRSGLGRARVAVRLGRGRGAGTRRSSPLAELPPVDAVVDLARPLRPPRHTRPSRPCADWETTFVVPLGVGAHLEAWGIPAGAHRGARLVGADPARRAGGGRHAGPPRLRARAPRGRDADALGRLRAPGAAPPGLLLRRHRALPGPRRDRRAAGALRPDA